MSREKRKIVVARVLTRDESRSPQSFRGFRLVCASRSPPRACGRVTWPTAESDLVVLPIITSAGFVWLLLWAGSIYLTSLIELDLVCQDVSDNWQGISPQFSDLNSTWPVKLTSTTNRPALPTHGHGIMSMSAVTLVL